MSPSSRLHLSRFLLGHYTQVRIGRNGRGDATDLTVTLANGQTKTLLSGTVHYPFGPAWWWTYGNGRKLTRSRTPSGRPGYAEDSRAGGLSEGYWFDAAGNLDSLRNASQADPPKRKYTYDGLDRLTEVRDGANNTLLQGYGYNATGDRTTDTNGATRSFAYATGTHRLNSAGSVNRAYDAAGNTIRIGGAAALAANRPALAVDAQAHSWRAQLQARAQTARATKRAGKAPGAPAKLAPATVREFAYDDAGRLRQVKHDGVVAMDYRYNAKGERVYRSGSGQTVHTVYDEAGHWLGDYDAAGNALQQAIWLDDLPVGLLVGAGTNQTLYYLEPDALGSPRVAIDPTRDVAVWRWDLTGEAFGNTAPNEDPDGDGIAFTLDMRFPGQRYDAASELVYNYFRDYDPTTGRYVESDPIGLLGGISTYSYVGANSLKRSDSLGLVDVALELYAAGVIDRMPNRSFFSSQPPMETAPPSNIPDSCGLSANCAIGSRKFDTIDQAVRDVLANVFERSRDLDIEVCGLVCQDRSSQKYFSGGQTWWTSTACPPGYKQCPACSRQVAWWHSHGAPNGIFNPLQAEIFSPDDMGISKETGLPGYLGTPQGYLRFYQPGASDAVHLGPLK